MNESMEEIKKLYEYFLTQNGQVWKKGLETIYFKDAFDEEKYYEYEIKYAKEKWKNSVWYLTINYACKNEI